MSIHYTRCHVTVYIGWPLKAVGENVGDTPPHTSSHDLVMSTTPFLPCPPGRLRAPSFSEVIRKIFLPNVGEPELACCTTEASRKIRCPNPVSEELDSIVSGAFGVPDFRVPDFIGRSVGRGTSGEGKTKMSLTDRMSKHEIVRETVLAFLPSDF